MRQITSIERTTRSRYKVYLDGAHALTVHEDTLVSHRLQKGMFLTDEEAAGLKDDNAKQDAYLAAIRYMGIRPRSVQEVYRQLQRKGYEEGSIRETLHRLQQERYLDDAEFAELWTSQRLRVQKKGSRWIKQELKQKGVAPPDISQAMERIQEEEEAAIALELAHKKWKQLHKEDAAGRRKLAAYLLRRGYPDGIVRQVIRHVTSQDVWEE